MLEFVPAMPDVRDDIDDVATILLHTAVVDFTHENESAGEVILNHRLEALGRDVFHGGTILSASIIHQPVNAPVFVENRINRADNVLLIAYVADLHHHFTAFSDDLGLYILEFVEVAANNDNISAQCSQLMRCTAADATAATRYYDGLTLKQIWCEY